MDDIVLRRSESAALLRALGHAFSSHEFDEDQLSDIDARVRSLLLDLEHSGRRVRTFNGDTFETFKTRMPQYGIDAPRALPGDAFVTGGSNPPGVGAHLQRDGDDIVIEFTLLRSFEGAPERGHGGVIAAVMDEAMGIALTMQGELAYTVQLDISYRAPTPIEKPLTARGWEHSRDGRKVTLKGELRDGDTLLVEATALFVIIDPATFLSRT